MSMAHSVEGRYPFLDHEVIELFARIPEHLKLADMEEKVILKRAFSDLLPPNVLNRKKQPYRAPEAISLLANAELMECLEAQRLRRFGMFDPETVARLRAKLERTRPGEFSFNENFAFVVILATQVFMEAFFDGSLTKLAVPPLPQVRKETISGRV
jgi:asparagine synthase (glutamine-hydrolysing)